MKNTFEKPLLTRIYQIFAVVCGVVAVFLLFTGNVTGFFAGIGMGITVYGLAQLFQYIGETAHYTRLSAEALERLSPVPEPPEPMYYPEPIPAVSSGKIFVPRR